MSIHAKSKLSRNLPNLCPKPGPDKAGRGEVDGEKDKDYEDQIKLLVNPDNPTPRGYVYQFLNTTTGNWVFVDDCQHQTGTRVEIKSNYDGLLTFPRGEERLTGRWLDQSLRQLQVSNGFGVMWVFAKQDSADFARKLFDNAEDGQQRIQTRVVPRVGASK